MNAQANANAGQAMLALLRLLRRQAPGLNVNAVELFAFLAAHGNQEGWSQGDLVDKLEHDRFAVRRACMLLDESGLIDIIQDRKDRRSRRIRLSARGMRLASAMERRMSSFRNAA